MLVGGGSAWEAKRRGEKATKNFIFRSDNDNGCSKLLESFRNIC